MLQFYRLLQPPLCNIPFELDAFERANFCEASFKEIFGASETLLSTAILWISILWVSILWVSYDSLWRLCVRKSSFFAYAAPGTHGFLNLPTCSEFFRRVFYWNCRNATDTRGVKNSYVWNLLYWTGNRGWSSLQLKNSNRLKAAVVLTNFSFLTRNIAEKIFVPEWIKLIWIYTMFTLYSVSQ